MFERNIEHLNRLIESDDKSKKSVSSEIYSQPFNQCSLSDLFGI